MKKIDYSLREYMKLNPCLRSVSFQVAIQQYLEYRGQSIKDLAVETGYSEEDATKRSILNFWHKANDGRYARSPKTLSFLNDNAPFLLTCHMKDDLWRLLNRQVSLLFLAKPLHVNRQLFQNYETIVSNEAELFTALKRCYKQSCEQLFNEQSLNAFKMLLLKCLQQQYFNHPRPTLAERYCYCAYLNLFGVKYSIKQKVELGFQINQFLNGLSLTNKTESSVQIEKDFSTIDKLKNDLDSDELTNAIKSFVLTQNNHPCFTSCNKSLH